MRSTVHDMFSVRNMFYSLADNVHYGKRPSQQSGQSRRSGQKPQKNKRLAGRARRKSWEVSQREATHLYKIYAAGPSPISNYFVAWAVDKPLTTWKPHRGDDRSSAEFPHPESD